MARKGRPRRIYVKGKHRYVIKKGRKYKLSKDLQKLPARELVRVVINNYERKHPKSKRKSTKKEPKQSKLNFSVLPNSAAAINAITEARSKYNQLSDKLQQQQIQNLTQIKDIENSVKNVQNIPNQLSDVQNEVRQIQFGNQLAQITAGPQQTSSQTTKPAKVKQVLQGNEGILKTTKGKTFIKDVSAVEKKLKEAEDKDKQLKKNAFDMKLVNFASNADKPTLLKIAKQLKVDSKTDDGKGTKNRKLLTSDLVAQSAEFDSFINSLNENDDKTAIDKQMIEFLNLQKHGKGIDNKQLANRLQTTGKGLYGSQIMEIMKPIKSFRGVFAADQLPLLAKQLTPKDTKVSFVMNLDDSGERGSHWVAVFIDTKNDKSLEYYDSFAREPNNEFMENIDEVIAALNPSTYLKFKVNRIIEQSADSDNCGYFAMKFIDDRERGIPFKECTKYSDVVNGEKTIKKFKEHILKFGYI